MAPLVNLIRHDQIVKAEGRIKVKINDHLMVKVKLLQSFDQFCYCHIFEF